MKKTLFTVISLLGFGIIQAQPTTYPVSAGNGGNATNSYYGDLAGANNTAAGNTFIGAESGESTTVGQANVFVGYRSGQDNTDGFNNVFVGYLSGYQNIGGAYNSFIGRSSGASNLTGQSNSFLGFNSGYSNTDGTGNVFLGMQSGYGNVSGDYNTFVGFLSGFSNLANYNVFLGFESGRFNSTGEDNTFNGAQSGYHNSTGSGNTFTGSHSGFETTTGANNTFIGLNSGRLNTTGDYNTFMGRHSGYHTTTGYTNTCVGGDSGFENTTGIRNSFLGSGSGHDNTTGFDNLYLGVSAGYYNETGSGNVFVGANAGAYETGSNLLYITNSISSNPLIRGNFSLNTVNVNGSFSIGLNPAIGQNPTTTLDVNGNARIRTIAQDNTLTRVLVSNNDGDVFWREGTSIGDNLGNHIAQQNITADVNGVYNIGSGASQFNDIFIDGSLLLDNEEFVDNRVNNVAVGGNTLDAVTTGNQNTAVGDNASQNLTTGINNVSIGRNTLSFNITGNSNTAVGFNAGTAQVLFGVALHNTTALGNGAQTTASNQVRIGNASVTNIGGYAFWSNVSDARVKRDFEECPGLDFVLKLRPITYQLDRVKLGELVGVPVEESQLSKEDRQAGFLAQDIEKIVVENKLSFSGGVETPEQDGLRSMQYEQIIAPLAKSIQELHAMIEAQQAKINQQQEEINQLKSTTSAKRVSSTPQTDAQVPNALSDSTMLGDCYPNPADAGITIPVNIADGMRKVFLIITTLNGTEIMSREIKTRGYTALVFEKGDLAPGIYLYSLKADGNLVDSKRMVRK